MELGKATWTQVKNYLKTCSTLVVPVGSTEQHGPTALIGTDYITAAHIANQVGNELNLMVAPSLNYGMANHHLAFPGSASLNPSTYIQVQLDLLRSWLSQGFKKFVYVNGHGGNTAPLNCAISELKREALEVPVALFNWWVLPQVQEYEKKHFGEENGHHATCGEVALTMHTHPEAFKEIPKTQFKVEHKTHHWPLSPSEMKHFYPDGRIASNPGLSTQEHGKALSKIATETICKKLKETGYTG